MDRQDLQEARELGGLLTDVKYIRKTLDDIQKYNEEFAKKNEQDHCTIRDDVGDLKDFKTRQTAYYAAATAIGAAIVLLVNWVISIYKK